MPYSNPTQVMKRSRAFRRPYPAEALTPRNNSNRIAISHAPTCHESAIRGHLAFREARYATAPMAAVYARDKHDAAIADHQISSPASRTESRCPPTVNPAPQCRLPVPPHSAFSSGRLREDLPHARKRVKWPGLAAVIVSVVHIEKGGYEEVKMLDGREVATITAFLFHRGSNDDPQTFSQNAAKSFQGTISVHRDSARRA